MNLRSLLHADSLEDPALAHDDHRGRPNPKPRQEHECCQRSGAGYEGERGVDQPFPDPARAAGT